MIPILTSFTTGEAQARSCAAHPGPRLWRSRFLPLALSVIFAASMWFYVLAILIPYEKADAARFGRPRGNLSDMYPRWLGSRELLLDHRDPYSREVTREIQVGYYGRELNPSRPQDPKDQQGFAYPAYVAFLLAPTVHLNFAMVQKVFGWMLAVFTIISIPLWARAMNWRPSRNSIVILCLLTLGSFPAVQGIKLQQLTLVVALLLAAAMAALSSGMLALAGMVLALATIKPQLSVPLAAWLMLWTGAEWRKRWPLAAGFILTVTLLVGGAEIVLPGWISKWLSAVAAYRQYTGGISLLDRLFTPVGGVILTWLLVLVAALLCWRFRQAVAGSAAFCFSTAFVLAVTVVIIPTFAPYNQLLLLPAIMVIVGDWPKLKSTPGAGLLSRVTVAFVAWPWAAAVLLALASAVLPAASVQKAWTLPLFSSLFIPFWIMLLLALSTVSLYAPVKPRPS